MTNIENILKKHEMADEIRAEIIAEIKENYKPVADWQKQKDKVDSLTASLNETQEALKAFDGVNVDELNKKIEELNSQIAKNEEAYQAKIADRDFNDLLKSAIADANGRNAKAITALLDVEALKSSQNQKEDIANALKTLSEAEDSKMLFGTEDSTPIGNISPIGTIKNTARPQTTLDEIYKGNPYYHPSGTQ